MTSRNKDQIYKKYLEKEKNKETVQEFYRCINEEDWDTIETLFHEDYFIPIPEHENQELSNLKNFSRQFIATFFDENHRRLSELGKEHGMSYEWPPTNNKEMLDIMKLEAKFEKVNVKLFYICAEEDIVWTTRSYELTEAVSGIHSVEIVHDRFLMMEGKIRQTESFHDYLSIMSRMGRFLYKQNDNEKIVNYLDNLRKLGIIGDDV